MSCNTGQNKGHYDKWRRVFYIEHISVQLVLINVYSYDGVCVSFGNKIPFLRRKFFFFECKVSFCRRIEGFCLLCVFFFYLCVVLRV